MDLDHEKIPFIDERALPEDNTVQRKFSDMTRRHSSSTFLEMENKDAAQAQDTIDKTVFPDSTMFPVIQSAIEHIVGASIPSSTNGTNNKQCSASGNFPAANESERRNNSFKFPLHSAAEKGNVKTLERLLIKGDPLAPDFKQKTPLHYACGFPYQKKALRMLEIILDSPQAQNTPEDGLRKKKLIDYQDKNGETGLHIAARTGHHQVVEKLLFSAADVNLRDNNGIEPLEVIYHKTPAAMKPVFDGAVECKVGDPNDQNLIVRLDFGAIVGYPEIEKDLTIFQMETKLLSYCLQQSELKRSAILLHPIVQVFLHLKWKKIRILLWISILFHVIWLLFYTLFITDLYLIRCPYITSEDKNPDHHEMILSNESDYYTTPTSIEMEDEIRNETNITTHAIPCELGKDLLSSLNIKLTFLFGISSFVAIKELYEIYSTPQLKFYFLQLENVGQWLLIGVVGLTSIPVFMIGNDAVGNNDTMRDNDTLRNDTSHMHNGIFIQPWQYQVSALGIFLAWSLILSQIGKIPRFGIYIEILGKVLRSFGMFMVTFASLLVAFTVAFQILMPSKVEFQSFPWGFMKVMVMMAGEINYDEVFYSEEASSDIPFPTSTKLLYAAFVSVVTIILFNLLIGLTVSDTQGLQSVAQLTSLSSQLDQIYLMERFIISKKLQGWLKMIKKNHWLRFFLVTQQTEDLETNMGIDIHISKIPSNLQHEVREVAIPNIGQENDQDEDEYEQSTSSQDDKSTPEDGSGEKATSGDATATMDLKKQIRDILRELLEELKAENHNNSNSGPTN